MAEFVTVINRLDQFQIVIFGKVSRKVERFDHLFRRRFINAFVLLEENFDGFPA